MRYFWQRSHQINSVFVRGWPNLFIVQHPNPPYILNPHCRFRTSKSVRELFAHQSSSISVRLPSDEEYIRGFGRCAYKIPPLLVCVYICSFGRRVCVLPYLQGWPVPYTYGQYTVFLAGKSPNIRSFMVYILVYIRCIYTVLANPTHLQVCVQEHVCRYLYM